MCSLSLFETLPDEIILEVCSYLYGGDVLYSLFNLNTRINIAITGYCRFVDLKGVTYNRFDYIICDILPQIASFVESFVFHGDREKLLSTKASTVFYGRPMSFTFPLLRKIRLVWFTVEDLLSFINILQDLSQLVQVKIHFHEGSADETLLTKILAANNNQLETVLLQRNSTFFNLPLVDHPFSYLNIKRLEVNIVEVKMLPYLFGLVPNVNRLYVSIKDQSSEPDLKQAFVNISPLKYLIDFHLCSIELFLDLDEIGTLLQAMSFLKTLTLEFSTKDEYLVQQENFIKILPACLKQVQFFIKYHFSQPKFEINILTAAWSTDFPINYLFDEIHDYVLMFTASFGPRLLDLPAVLGKQVLHSCKYTQQVKDLYVYGSTSVADALLTVQHFHHLQKLSINARNIPRTCALMTLKQPTLLNFPHLKRLNVSGICSLFDILKVAPNLDDLVIDFDCLKILIDDEPTCDILHQVIYLEIRCWPDNESDLLERVTRVFGSLRQLYLKLQNPNISNESISTILVQSIIKQLTAFYIEAKFSEEISNNLRQWMIDHTYLMVDELFSVANIEDCFVLWK